MNIDARGMAVGSCRFRLCVLAMAFAACGTAGGSPNSASAVTSLSGGNQAAMWRIRFTQSGGFAGLQRELDVTNAGEVIARDVRRNREVKVRLDDAEVARLSALLAQAPPDAAATSALASSQCRDCLEYGVDATADGQRIAAHLIDTELDASGFRPLVTALVEILTRSLATTQP